MRTVVFADIHLKAQDQFGSVQKLDIGNIETRNLAKIKKLISIVEQEEPDRVIIAGDLFSSSRPPEILRWLFFEMFKIKCPTYIISGNHDIINKMGIGKSESARSDWFTYISPQDFLLVDNILLVGYCREDAIFVDLMKQKTDFLISHRDVKNITNGFKAEFYGHVHENKMVFSEKWQIGSPFKESWAEENHGHYYLVIENDTYKFVEIPSISIKTFGITNLDSLPKQEDLNGLFSIRLNFIGKADFIRTINEKEIRQLYDIKTKIKYTIQEDKKVEQTTKEFSIKELFEVFGIKHKIDTDEVSKYYKAFEEAV